MDPGADAFYWAGCCLALAVVIVILLRRSSRYFGRRSRDETPIVRLPRGVEPARGGTGDPAAERMREEVRLHETARELFAQLDNKISVLEYLTGTAQQQIDRLEALIEQAAGTAQDGPSRPGNATGRGAAQRPADGERTG